MFTMFTEAAPEALTTGITILPVPIVCQDETQDALVALVDLDQELADGLTYEQWLWEQTQECCQDLGIEYVSIRREKEATLVGLYEEIDAIVADIAAISDRDSATLTADFNDATVAGTVTEVPDETVLADTPEECQQSTKDARQDAADACDEVSAAQTYKAWLEAEFETECTTEIDDLQAAIDDNTPRLTAAEADKANLFATWWALEALENETEEEFVIRLTSDFDAAFDSLDIVSAGMIINDVPETCGQDTQDKFAEAQQFVDDLERVLTFCDWLANQAVRACDDQQAEIMDILMVNMPRLSETEDRIESVLAELIAEKPGSSDGDMTIFATMKEGEYILANPAKSDIGIVVPDVPEGCDDDTKSAQAAL